MPAFTKKVVGILDLEDPNSIENRRGEPDIFLLSAEYNEKIVKMMAEGKTDGYLDKNLEGNVLTRIFLDEAAAQEWIDYLTERFVHYNLSIPVMEIQDL